ncbi:MAG: hypothetical protein Q7P63_11155 [Verrucomicrobiota bacterium JB022]|nr:hypothetical protein [Verrucomicrobiota bacterium JB022]
MLWKWLPWNYLIRRAARSYGFADPATTLARVRNFAQPSEFEMPLEIVRHAVLFHSRGLINTRAIQHNLDWIWPYWIERQFNPRDPSFLPRAFHFSHINLTHRNWTAVGLPDLGLYSLVDPRGLVTPMHDGWSIDAWILGADGQRLIPSRRDQAKQQLAVQNHCLKTRTEKDGMRLQGEALGRAEQTPWLELDYHAYSQSGGWLVISLRPYNPEGISFIDSVETRPDNRSWLVNNQDEVRFKTRPEYCLASNYHDGDVYHELPVSEASESVKCRVGMATAAAVFPLKPGEEFHASIEVPLARPAKEIHPQWKPTTWEAARRPCAQARIPDKRFQFVYDASVNSLIHLSAEKIYPGPYTYRRFWFRDAAIMLGAVMALGLKDRAAKHLSYFPTKQRADGYFESQEGEWDSNGEVLWAYGRYHQLFAEKLPNEWLNAMEKAVRWLGDKRMPKDDSGHAGLLPAGFSAEHFGPNDHYYWDDYWAIGGMQLTADAFAEGGKAETARLCRSLAEDYSACVERSIQNFALRKGRGAIPASPYRRMDSGAIGVLVADYPLQLYPAGDERIAKTVDFFLKKCWVEGGFFQDMTHSGMNIYLTLDIAQTLLRHGDNRWQDVVRAVVDMASATGQWPEAIHPHTKGGCIGDGQHGWASAEFFMWVRNAFVREEGERLVIGSGLLPEWIESGEPMSFGPAPTPWGEVRVAMRHLEDELEVQVLGEWRGQRPEIEIALPGFSPERLPEGAERVTLSLQTIS